MQPQQLADMISSRICHDLISPVGAISNGVELLGVMNGLSPEMELINQSADNAKAKLMFFRVAFGASQKGAMIGYNSASSVASEMYASGRVSISFPTAWGDRERSLVKLLYLLILCVESSLPHGGGIRCAPTDTGWKIDVKDTRIDADQSLWGPLLHGASFGDLTSNQIQFKLAQSAADKINIKITATIDDNGLTLVF